LDGFGYPQGTLGGSLSMAGQILAVAEMLMGLVETEDSPCARAAVAMKLVPGEFNRRFVDRIAQAARAAGEGAARGGSAAAVADLHARVAGLAGAVGRVRALRGALATEMARFGAPLRALLNHAFERWERIAIAFSSTGLDQGGEGLLGAMDDQELAEVAIV